MLSVSIIAEKSSSDYVNIVIFMVNKKLPTLIFYFIILNY